MTKHKNLIFTTYWAKFVFASTFLSLYPIQLVLVQKKRWHKYGHKLNRIIIKTVFKAAGIKVIFNYHYRPKKDLKYIFCSNHSSYFDIPSFFYLQERHIKFVGKSSLEKIPLFGYMFKRLYISLNRRDKDSRAFVIEECRKSLIEGNSIAIYPEGTIPIKSPNLINFKDGAFKLSIEENIPIIPVTLPLNHLLLPVNSSFLRSKTMKIIVHEPLNTPENPITDIQELKEKTFLIIENELKNHGLI